MCVRLFVCFVEMIAFNATTLNSTRLEIFRRRIALHAFTHTPTNEYNDNDDYLSGKFVFAIKSTRSQSLEQVQPLNCCLVYPSSFIKLIIKLVNAFRVSIHKLLKFVLFEKISVRLTIDTKKRNRCVRTTNSFFCNKNQ